LAAIVLPPGGEVTDIVAVEHMVHHRQTGIYGPSKGKSAAAYRKVLGTAFSINVGDRGLPTDRRNAAMVEIEATAEIRGNRRKGSMRP